MFRPRQPKANNDFRHAATLMTLLLRRCNLNGEILVSVLYVKLANVIIIICGAAVLFQCTTVVFNYVIYVYARV